MKIITLLIILISISCANQPSSEPDVSAATIELPSSVYSNSYDQVWLATLHATTNLDFAMANKEKSIMKTRWIDNTSQYNFLNSLEGKDEVKAAKFKIVIKVIKGHQYGKTVNKVTIYNRQHIKIINNDTWIIVATDNIKEQVLFYKINRYFRRNKLRDKLSKQTQEPI